VELAIGIIIFAAIVYGWHRLSVLMWPNRPCRWCHGTGRNWGSNKDRWGRCWFCHGQPRKRKGAKG